MVFFFLYRNREWLVLLFFRDILRMLVFRRVIGVGRERVVKVSVLDKVLFFVGVRFVWFIVVLRRGEDRVWEFVRWGGRDGYIFKVMELIMRVGGWFNSG